MSKYGVFSGLYFPVFELNTGKYRPQKLCIWTLLTQRWTLQIIIFHLKRVFWTFSLALIISEIKSVININLCKKYLTRLFSLLVIQTFKDINSKEDGGHLLKTLETFSEKQSIFYSLIWYADVCSRQGVRIASFSGKSAYELSK